MKLNVLRFLFLLPHLATASEVAATGSADACFGALAIWQIRFERRIQSGEPDAPARPHAEETTPREAAQLLLQSSLECPDWFEPFCLFVRLT